MKILISCLGLRYEEATYKYFDVEGTFSAPVLALKHFYKPDKMIVIGTETSDWSNFYNNIFDGEKKLKSEEDCYDINVVNEAIKQKDESITAVFVKFGINDEEIDENFDTIQKALEKTINSKEEVYELAIDITNAFRSIPMYNLSAINYLNVISSFNISIENIFYAMFEAKKELKLEYVPIIDIVKFQDNLYLTSAVNEFKNTGNSTSIKKYLENKKNEKNFNNDLKKFNEDIGYFDWSTQINDSEETFNALKEIYNIQNNSKTDNVASSAINYIQEALQKEFVSAQDFNKMNSNNPLDIAKFRFNLMKWYFEHGRIANAVLLCQEVVRDYMVLVNRGNSNININDFQNESIRAIAEDELKRYSGQRSQIAINNNEPNAQFFSNVSSEYKDIKDFRNKIGHFLLGGRGSLSQNDENTIKTKLKEFIELRLAQIIYWVENNNFSEFQVLKSRTVSTQNANQSVLIIPKRAKPNGDIVSKLLNTKFNRERNFNNNNFYLIPDKMYTHDNNKVLFNKKNIFLYSKILSDYIIYSFPNNTIDLSVVFVDFDDDTEFLLASLIKSYTGIEKTFYGIKDNKKKIPTNESIVEFINNESIDSKQYEMYRDMKITEINDLAPPASLSITATITIEITSNKPNNNIDLNEYVKKCLILFENDKNNIISSNKKHTISKDNTIDNLIIDIDVSHDLTIDLLKEEIDKIELKYGSNTIQL